MDSDFTVGFKQGQEHGKQIMQEQYEARLTELRSMALRVKHNTGSIDTLIDKLDDLLSESKQEQSK